MNSVNKFLVIGRLKDNPSIRTLESGAKVSNIVVVTERDYKDKEGNKITDYLNFALWNKDAENLCQISKKGALITLEGYNTTKEVEVNGEKHYEFHPVVTKYKHLANAKNYTSEPIKEENQEEIIK